MKDEFTYAMHEELTIDAETEIKHKVACVKKLLGTNYTQKELDRYCTLYNIPPLNDNTHVLHRYCINSIFSMWFPASSNGCSMDAEWVLNGCFC